MSSEKRQRYALLGFALLLHCAVFFALWHFIIFPAPPAEQDSSGFTKIAVPARFVPPPAAPAASAALPTFAPTTPASQQAPIVTSAPSTFALPKVEMPTPSMPNLPPPTTAPAAQALATSSANTGATGTAGTGNGNGIAGAIDSYAAMSVALKGDTRGGEIVGMCVTANQPYSNAAAIDDIITTELPIIGWNVNDPRVDQDRPGIRHGKDVPPLSPHPEWFENNPNTIGDVIAARVALQRELKNIQIKTIIIVGNFKNVDLSRFDNRNQFGDLEDRRPSVHNLNTAAQDNELTLLITILRARGIRLCVISFENPPFPAIQNYVTESGGIVLYPKGVPLDKIESQLKNTALAK